MSSWQGCTRKRNATLRAAKNQYVFQLFGGSSVSTGGPSIQNNCNSIFLDKSKVSLARRFGMELGVEPAERKDDK